MCCHITDLGRVIIYDISILKETFYLNGSFKCEIILIENISGTIT